MEYACIQDSSLVHWAWHSTHSFDVHVDHDGDSDEISPHGSDSVVEQVSELLNFSFVSVFHRLIFLVL